MLSGLILSKNRVIARAHLRPWQSAYQKPKDLGMPLRWRAMDFQDILFCKKDRPEEEKGRAVGNRVCWR